MVCSSPSQFRTALAALVLVQIVLPATCLSQRRSSENHWVDIWGAMPQLVEYTNMPPVPFNQSGLVFQNATLRQTIFLTQSAPTIRLVVSNAFGAADLPITAASVGVPPDGAAGASAVDPASLARVTWSGGQAGIVIPNGARAVSDPLEFPVAAQRVLAVSLYLADGQATNAITGHPGSRTTSYYTPGDATAAADVAGMEGTQASSHWYFLSGVEAYVPTALGTRALVVVGDSITDGRGVVDNSNTRWPDLLLRRLQQQDATNATNASSSSSLLGNIAVINQAAGGNRVLYDGNGPNAWGRIDRDVLAHSGVAYALLFEGVNDIGGAAAEDSEAVGTRLIAAYNQVISMVHARGLPIFGATIAPFGGEGQAYDTPAREATRQRVNAWVRTAGRFDAVVDFDAVLRWDGGGGNASRLDPAYDSGDHLHPSALGYQAMADAFDVGLLERFQDGAVEAEV